MSPARRRRAGEVAPVGRRRECELGRGEAEADGDAVDARGRASLRRKEGGNADGAGEGEGVAARRRVEPLVAGARRDVAQDCCSFADLR